MSFLLTLSDPPPPLHTPPTLLNRPKPKRVSQKKNPLRNLNIMLRLNPYAKTFRRNQLLLEMRRRKEKAELLDKKRGTKK